MEHTANYNLTQWAMTDRIQMADFNADNQKLDAALAAHDGRVALLEAAAPHHGNCQIWTTTYVGNGQCGDKHPNTLTFPEKPVLVIITGAGGGTPMCFSYGCPNAYFCIYGTGSRTNTVKWNGNSLSWYCDLALAQMNESNRTYYVTVFLRKD